MDPDPTTELFLKAICFCYTGENELPSWFGDERLQQLLIEAEQTVSDVTNLVPIFISLFQLFPVLSLVLSGKGGGGVPPLPTQIWTRGTSLAHGIVGSIAMHYGKGTPPVNKQTPVKTLTFLHPSEYDR